MLGWAGDREAVNMPDIATNAYPIAYADWRSTAYRICDKVNGFNMLNAIRTRFRRVAWFDFHARRRVGGQVVQPQAIQAAENERLLTQRVLAALLSRPRS